MDAKPSVSVLIPIYNVEPYLLECLQSLQKQSFQNFEALCLNDGSTDNSKAIIEQFTNQDSRFKLVDKPNSGYGATMNLGLSLAQGNTIAILESDDMMLPKALQALYQAHLEHDADITKGNFLLYWSKDQTKNYSESIVVPEMVSMPWNNKLREYIFLQKASIWSALYRKQFLIDNEINFLETPGASYQDTSFAFKAWAAAKRVAFITSDVIAYRQDNENSSVNSKEKAFCVCQEYQEIHRWIERHIPEQTQPYIQNQAYISQYNAYLWNLDRLSENNKLPFLQNMRKEFLQAQSSGKLDLNLWTYWRRLNLETIFANPDKYITIRTSSSENTLLSKARFALKLGGIRALIMAISNRQTNRLR